MLNQINGITLLIFYILIFVAIYYFFLVMPQRRREQARRELMSNLRVNDEVMTIGGIIGTVREVGEDTISLQIDANTTMRVSKEAIAENLSRIEEGEEAA